MLKNVASMRVLSIGVWLISALLLLNIARIEVMSRMPAPDWARAVPPYTIVLAERTVMPDGSSRPGGRYVYAARSDGSYVHRSEFLRPNLSNKRAAQRMLLLMSGARVELDEIRELKSSVALNTRNLARVHRDPRSRCLNNYHGVPFTQKQEYIGDERVGGLTCVRVKNESVSEWLAVDLGCALVKRRQDFGTSASELTAESVTGGEPAAELFEIPARFREVRPTELFGLNPSSKAGKQRDEFYLSHRPPPAP